MSEIHSGKRPPSRRVTDKPLYLAILILASTQFWPSPKLDVGAAFNQ